ncbi:6-hydroxymethylpterin diphosphokinase MptE-like protein [Treponema phagedenis]|uniref:6-hydroxymethylpterin diphosphokinase MptE-like protein n=1 Tax=Treponema phagedenis TaxID=162 RepID=UPI0001F638E5|nr:6-hydroxymethylpterin diphosphokinase MptE-like protein [Treponema phagedenis]EFW36559.1 hypothetical protein HMPREF9554_02965 [Treponema phagedenis F0421]TYT77903.1 DUF115 domain-containing protein [Treponema phagedenis]
MIPQVALHSKYNPQKEAETFAGSIKTNPAIIVISEPGESYAAESLRKRFPSAKLIALRYSQTLFSESDFLWDSVWRPQAGSLEFFLIQNIHDEELSNTIFIPWKPADRAFPDEAKLVWQGIATAIKMIQSEMATRTFFGKRWLANILRNSMFAEQVIDFSFYAERVIFAAAGQSLEKCLSKKTGAPIAAVSSALSALAYRGVKPIFCVSTDGGFWAAAHLKRIATDIPVLFPLEAAIPSNVLINNPLSFLNYGSKTESFFLDALQAPSISAQRNGSVSGTMAELLFNFRIKKIYLCGLDLAEGKGFQHARPHASGIAKTFRTMPLASIIAKGGNPQSLEIYANWFMQLPKEKTDCLIRVGEEGRALPSIKTISLKAFLTQMPTVMPQIRTQTIKKISKKDRFALVHTYLLLLEKTAKLKNGATKFLERGIEKEAAEFLAYPELLVAIKNRGTKERSIAAQKLCEKVSVEIKKLRQRLQIHE